MATVSYDRDIVISKEAAERLIEILAEPALPEPESNDEFWQNNERSVKDWLSRFKT